VNIDSRERRAKDPEEAMIADQEVRQFLEQGAVTIDTPLTEAQIGAASAAVDRLLPFRPPGEGERPHYRLQRTGDYFDPELLEILQHPFFEAVARRALGAEEVRFFQTAIAISYPQPNTRFSFDQHVDIQYNLSDLKAVPRRIICSFFLWLTDVTERRAPMMFRPGSHWLIAADREKNPALPVRAPRVAGAGLLQLPPLAYAEPVPLVARAGQVSVLTTAAVHGASVNVDTEPRKVLVLTWTPASVTIDLPPDQEAQKRKYDEELRRHLRPERMYIVS
jgi:hypothetical protein